MSQGSENTPEGAQQPPEGGERKGGVSRRGFLQGMGVTSAIAAIPLNFQKARAEEAVAGIGPAASKMSLNINGANRVIDIEPRTTLLDAVRDHAGLTGTKKVCDRGACGACTVMVDGESVCSCLMLAADARGKQVRTIEGIAHGDGTLDPIQAQFIEHDALQCGFCTPGFIVRARAFLNEVPSPNLVQVREGLSGNICRCGTYNHIFDAVLSASKKGA